MHPARAPRRLERLLRPHVNLFGRTIPAFHLCGYVGLGLMSAVMCAAASASGASVPMTLALAPLSIIVFLVSAMASKILTGVEQVIYYRNQLLVLAAAALALHIAGLPILQYLDILILGIGAFTACGRIGCLMVGCCHGRPARRGIRYCEAHADAGFPRALVGVPLAPVQVVESVWIVCVVAVGLRMLPPGQYQSGDILAWYTIAYGVGRFIFELFRGDPERPYLLGLSEAQWTAAATVAAVGIGEATRLLPFHGWHLVTMGLLLLASAVLVASRAWAPWASGLLEPLHVLELARALRSLDAENISRQDERAGWASIPMRTTSRGLTISASRTSQESGWMRHYAFSSQEELGSSRAAIVRMLILLSGASGRATTMEGNGGIHHLFIRPEAEPATASIDAAAPRIFRVMNFLGSARTMRKKSGSAASTDLSDSVYS